MALWMTTRCLKKLRFLELGLLTLSVCFIFDTVVQRFKIAEESDLTKINAAQKAFSGNYQAELLSSAFTTFSTDEQNQKLAIPLLPVNSSRHVLVLGYQRCGSSLMGLLFNANPNAFFLFEPADGVYSAMYGTANGWNVPTDIFNFKNGLYRQIPEIEINAVASTLNNLLTCNIEAVPTEVLTHSFMSFWIKRQQRAKPFVRCIDKQKSHASDCLKHIRPLCPSRFGKDMERHMKCRMLLWDVRAHPTDYNMTYLIDVLNRYKRDYSTRTMLSKPIEEAIAYFKRYHACMRNVTHRVSQCYSTLTEICEKSTVRSIKTVRATMETAHVMMSSLTDLRVIHVMRDPRPVSLSRLKQTSFRGINSGRNITKEAKFYCDRALHDVYLRRNNSLSYPFSYHQMIYEDLSNNPVQRMAHMYKFLQSSVPPELAKWVHENTQHTRNSSQVATSWMSKLTYEQAYQIDKVCYEFKRAVRYTWP